ncbi:DegT/DnrJ/EryC1/StrS family aminotransferase [Candidatus Micrarchaeota archaeon]|nr:DegT/DnrJ/EryC1/StrS family aminotransferase [Candidatus Micrarchaeota archaeon]
MIILEKPVINREMIDAAIYSLENEFPLFGESVAKFEEEFAKFCNVDHAVSTASGTDALLFSLLALGVKMPVTTPCSYIATANVAHLAGGKALFADIDSTNNIDPEKIAKTRKFDAVLPVHLHGYPAKMDDIMEIAEKNNVPVIEDACQAHGAIYRGKRAGSIGHVGCFSFNPVKNMTVCSQGGMAVTNDEKLAKKIRMLADSGRESIYSHEHRIIGYSSRLSSAAAAIGRVQLKYLDGWNEKRREAAGEYAGMLDKRILPPLETKEIKPVYNKFAIKISKRNETKEYLLNNNVQCDAHYPIPIHMQEPYKKQKLEFRNAEKFSKTTLSIPMHPEITKKEIKEVSALLADLDIVFGIS